ncbi:hypothetical protein BH18ACI4_BH18ACI4_14480 [soil metagenome]
MNEANIGVSSSPSKIPYGGFSQYGFKREVHGDLHAALRTRVYTPCKCGPRTLWPLLAC